MSRFTRIAQAVTIGLVFAALCTAAPLAAQGKGNAKSKTDPPGQAKKRVTTSQAVVVMREVLVSQGFSVVRVERVGATDVVYYRRGNNGRGKGLGPVEKIVVRPSGDIVVFEAAPKDVLLQVNIRLGL